MRQLAAPLGGRGKKFRVNLTQNLKVEGRKVAEWCRLVGREDKVAQVGPVSPGDVVGVHPIHILLNKLK